MTIDFTGAMELLFDAEPLDTEPEVLRITPDPDETRDIPKDCHTHCTCWVTDGHCCECGDNNMGTFHAQADGYSEDDDEALFT